jgi:hypothetical protein
MKTILSENLNSAAIRAHFGDNMELEIIGTTGSGDSKLTLLRARTGQEVIETNGAPCWETDEGFTEMREQIEA